MYNSIDEINSYHNTQSLDKERIASHVVAYEFMRKDKNMCTNELPELPAWKSHMHAYYEWHMSCLEIRWN